MTRTRFFMILCGIALAAIVLLCWWPSRAPDSFVDTHTGPLEDSPRLQPAAVRGSAAPPDVSIETPAPVYPEPSSSKPVVTGRVVDMDLRPITGGDLQVRALNSPDMEILEQVPVDEAGRFRLFNEDVLRRVSLIFIGPGHHAEEGRIDLHSGRFVELIAQALHTIRVRVVDKNGAPVANARVDGNLRKVRGSAGAARTNDEGECDLIMGSGTFFVTAQTDTNLYGSVMPVDVPEQDRVTVTLDRELAEVLIRVVPAHGSEHLSGTRVTLTPCHGIYPIRGVEATVGGDHAVVPLAYVDQLRSAAIRARSPQSRDARVRYVKTLLARIGDGVEFRVPVRWSHFVRAKEGNVLILPVEDMAHDIVLHLRDMKGNPVRGYAFRLARHLPEARDQALTNPLRVVEARSDHDGTAVCRCATGTYTGPFAGRLEVDGPFERDIVVGVTTAYGTAEPRVGEVRVVPLGQENADWSSFAKVPLQDGRWYVNLEGVTPGTTLVAQWMDRWAPLTSTEVVAGGPPVHLEVASVIQNPHQTTLRVCDGGRPVWCQVKLDTRRAREPRVQRDLVGLRAFDLSGMPPGKYFVEVTTRGQLVYLFDRPVHVGMGEALEIDLQEADRVWDGHNGAWLRER